MRARATRPSKNTDWRSRTWEGCVTSDFGHPPLGTLRRAAITMADAVINVHDLSKTYQLGELEVRALRGVSLTIERGEFVAIMGASGSGKSTLMNIVGCLDRPTAGKYLLDGVDVSELDRDDRAVIRNAKIGFVFQSFNLLARTSAVENTELPLLYGELGWSRDQRHKAALESLHRVGLAGRENNQPSQLS